MSTDQLRQAITQPAVRAGCVVEGALLARLVAEGGGRVGALPLVSHALLETWRRRRGNTLTLAGYEAAGGIEGGLAQSAEAVYEGFTAEQQRLARGIFLRLTAPGEGTEDTKRRIDRAELDNDDPNTALVVDTLARARLLTVGTNTVEITHEVLIRSWPRLRQWLAEDRDGLRLHRQLTDATTAWESLHQDPGALYRGTRLALASEWAARDDTALTPREREFLDASTAAETRERVATQRRNRQLRWLAAVLAVLLVATAGVTVVALDQREDALLQQRAATAHGLVAQADSVRDRDPRTALRLGVAARHIVDDPNARRLVCSIPSPTQPSSRPSPATPVTRMSVAWSPDGRTLATASNDNILLWDMTNPDQPRRYR